LVHVWVLVFAGVSWLILAVTYALAATRITFIKQEDVTIDEEAAATGGKLNIGTEYPYDKNKSGSGNFGKWAGGPQWQIQHRIILIVLWCLITWTFQFLGGLLSVVIKESPYKFAIIHLVNIPFLLGGFGE